MTKVYDIAIVGGGPAGLSAALTGRIRNKKVVLFERGEFSPKLQKAHMIDNYLGMPNVVGKDMMKTFEEHVMKHKPDLIKERVLNIYPNKKTFLIMTEKTSYEAKTVIIATGVSANSNIKGEKEFLGRGVSYCATCDAMFFKGKEVAVVSYMSEAESEAEYLAELCNKVYYLPQYKTVESLKRSNIEVLPGLKPLQIKGETKVSKLITVKDELNVEGIFILRQADPINSIIEGIEMDKDSIKVDRQMMTNIPGIFAAGDNTGQPWQISKAVGEGLTAVLNAITYLIKTEKQEKQEE